MAAKTPPPTQAGLVAIITRPLLAASANSDKSTSVREMGVVGNSRRDPTLTITITITTIEATHTFSRRKWSTLSLSTREDTISFPKSKDPPSATVRPSYVSIITSGATGPTSVATSPPTFKTATLVLRTINSSLNRHPSIKIPRRLSHSPPNRHCSIVAKFLTRLRWLRIQGEVRQQRHRETMDPSPSKEAVSAWSRMQAQGTEALI